MDYNNNETIAGQLHLANSIVADLWHSWAIMARAAILQVPHPAAGSAEAAGEVAELMRLMRRYSSFTPFEFDKAILAAARAKQHESFAKLRPSDIEEMLQSMAMEQRGIASRGLSVRNPVWKGAPSDALDANWGRIWEQSLKESRERNERVRAFMVDYLDPYDQSQADEIRIRDLAFNELKKRVVADGSPSVLNNGRALVREEMVFRLVKLFPKYIGDIERQMGNASFDDLDAVANELYTMATQAGHTRNLKRVSREDCSWAVYFDMYAAMMGCKWPEFNKENRAPKDAAKVPMTNYGKIIAEIRKEFNS